jgi:hypothetical protein
MCGAVKENEKDEMQNCLIMAAHAMFACSASHGHHWSCQSDQCQSDADSPQVLRILVPPIIAGIDPLRARQGMVTRGPIQSFKLKTASAVQFSQAGFTINEFDVPMTTVEVTPLNACWSPV